MKMHEDVISQALLDESNISDVQRDIEQTSFANKWNKSDGAFKFVFFVFAFLVEKKKKWQIMSLLIKGFKEKAFAASSRLDGNFWKIHLNSKGETVNATREGWAKLITFFKSLISYSNHREPNYFPPLSTDMLCVFYGSTFYLTGTVNFLLNLIYANKHPFIQTKMLGMKALEGQCYWRRKQNHFMLLIR